MSLYTLKWIRTLAAVYAAGLFVATLVLLERGVWRLDFAAVALLVTGTMVFVLPVRPLR